MTPILNFTCTDRSIGLLVRPTRSGPESELTSEFIERTMPILRDRKRHFSWSRDSLISLSFHTTLMCWTSGKTEETV